MTSQCKAAEQQRQRTQNDTLVSLILCLIEIVVTENFSSAALTTTRQTCIVEHIGAKLKHSQFMLLGMLLTYSLSLYGRGRL